jgi:NADH dehydrogenase
MKEILVIGGGFAGMWSAAGAVRAAREAGAGEEHLRVTLVSGGDDLVVRPRMYEDDPETMRVPLDRVLGPIGVRRVTATVTGIDTEAHSVRAIARSGEDISLSYDKLVLATGSQLLRPGGLAGSEYLFDVDTMPGAARLDHHLRRLPRKAQSDGRYTAVVVGAGFTGLEIATALVERLGAIAEPHGDAENVRVVLVDRAEAVAAELGEGPRPAIEAAIEELKIESRLGVTVSSVTPTSVTLSDGEVIPTATVVWTAGMVASPLTRQIPGRHDRLGRLAVDEHLRVVGVPDVYAAGDTAHAPAEDGHTTMQSCQHAQPMGKFAGHNVAADLFGNDLLPFAPDPYGVCIDLGAGGAVRARGWDRDREVVSTGEEAKTLKRNINAMWIYPPLDDADKILAQAGRFTNG